jgi:hypothetical protein
VAEHDPLEREADEVADRVMRMPNPAAAADGVLQRACEACAEEHGENVGLQRKGAGGAVAVAAAPPIVHAVLRSPGQPLDASTRAFMEPRFGHSFGNVQVHADARASESARAVDALAYTVGSHIVLSEGSYAPQDTAGRALLAHELAHVVQQGKAEPAGARTLQRKKPKPKSNPAPAVHVTADDVDEKVGPLTAEIAEKVLAAYGSPFAGQGATLVAAFEGQGVPAWIGLAIMKEESSLGNHDNNAGLDERNDANPFSVHFTQPERWSERCKKNALLISDPNGSYTSQVRAECSAKGVRLPTFQEAAKGSARTVQRKGLDAYREKSGYKAVINGHLNDMVRKIKLGPKAK